MSSFHLRLIRHGETEANVVRRLESHTPTPLNEHGRRQAAALAAALKTEDATFARVISSDTTRVRQTCETALPESAAHVHLEPRARERDGGALDGLYYDEAGRRQMKAREAGETIEGLESPEQVQARAAQVFEQLSAEMSQVGGEAVVFSHAGWIHMLLTHLQQSRGLKLQDHLPDGAPLHFCWNTGQTRLLVPPTGDVICLYLHNDDHLTGDLAPTDYLQIDGSKRPRNAKAVSVKGSLML